MQQNYFCADCKTAQVRDVLAGTDMTGLDLAAMDKRLIAWLVDGMVKFGISFVIGIVGQIAFIGFSNPTSPKMMLQTAGLKLLFSTLGYLLGMVYEGYMLVNNNGQTLGKMAVKIRVVTAEGNPLARKQAWWRAALKMLLFFVGCECCIGIMLDGIFALGVERASLHDLGAKTRVVNAD
ncbi:MAG: RDD family protein [Planctomycetota bacterium]